MKIAFASLAVLAFVLAAIFSGCDQAPLEPELVAGAAGAAAAPCTYLPATTPSKVVPPPTWGQAATGVSWRYIPCEDGKRALCIYYEGQYDLKVMDCSPAAGFTCAWTCE